MRYLRAYAGTLCGAGALLAGYTEAAAQTEEIVVTARRYEERLQDTPVAVTAITSRSIENLGLTSLNDLSRYAPGLSFQKEFGRRNNSQNQSIRGVTNVSNSAINFPSVANFVDGVYIPGSLDSFDLNDVERVEIIRGPQAALYGRATESGAINYVTKLPTNEFRASAMALRASYDEKRLGGNASGPIAPGTLFFTVGGSVYSKEGQYRNLVDGNKVGAEHAQTAAASLRWTPTDRLDVTARFNYTRISDDTPAIGFQSSAYNNCFLATYPYYCGAVPTKDYVNINTTGQPNGGYSGVRRKDMLGSLAVNYDLGGWSLGSITAVGRYLELAGVDGSYANTLGPVLGTNDSDRNISQELRILSPRDRPLKFIAGLYYYHENKTSRDSPVTTGGVNEFEIENRAVFGQVSYEVLTGLNLSAELRLSQDDVDYANRTVTSIAPFANKSSYHDANPRFIVDYKLTPDAMIYGTVAKGTKPGGYNSAATVATLTSNQIAYSEEKLWSYEVGAKTSWFDNRLIANLALYYQDISNQQLSTNVPTRTGGSTSINVNAGKSHSQGLEVELRARLLEQLGATVNYAYNQTEFDTYLGLRDLCYLAGIYTAACGNGGPQSNAKGKEFPNAPSHILSVALDWTAPLAGNWNYFVRPSYSYRSSVFEQAENLTETGDRSRFNLRLGVESELVTLTVFGNNIFGDRHAEYILRYLDFAAPGGAYGLRRAFPYALPDKRSFGVEARIKFAAPPASPAVTSAATAVAVQKPIVPKNYLVFFDFDRSDLTTEAARIVESAAANAKVATVTRLEVSGHADRSGSDAYNLRLSERRAETVKAQLVRNGVPAGDIVTFAKGESQPLVPTADGVREPQNRRVEIIYK